MTRLHSRQRRPSPHIRPRGIAQRVYKNPRSQPRILISDRMTSMARVHMAHIPLALICTFLIVLSCTDGVPRHARLRGDAGLRDGGRAVRGEVGAVERTRRRRRTKGSWAHMIQRFCEVRRGCCRRGAERARCCAMYCDKFNFRCECNTLWG